MPYSKAKIARLRDPVFLTFEPSTAAYCIDAFSISMGVPMHESRNGIHRGVRRASLLHNSYRTPLIRYQETCHFLIGLVPTSTS
ncbi:hypothetical protein BC827DRAFT_1241675 [Russula dissimulans]|nr:hypothetical protein BC827DRAFT_1241675 [Russula dissimulans]